MGKTWSAWFQGGNVWLRALLLAVIILVMLFGASKIVGSAYFHPAFLPVEFELHSDGSISVNLNAQIATPIGDFGAGASALQNLTAPSGGLLLKIEHVLQGEPQVAAFQVGEDDSEKIVNVDNGDLVFHITGQLVAVDGRNHHTILLTSPNAADTGQEAQSGPTATTGQSPQVQPTTPPAGEPTVAQQQPTTPPAPDATPTPEPDILTVTPLYDQCTGPQSTDPPYHWPPLLISNPTSHQIDWATVTDEAPDVYLSPSTGSIPAGSQMTVPVMGSVGPTGTYSSILGVEFHKGDYSQDIQVSPQTPHGVVEVVACWMN